MTCANVQTRKSLLCIEKIESSNRFWMLFHETMITYLQLCLDMQNFLKLGSHNRKKHLSLLNSTTVSDLPVKP